MLLHSGPHAIRATTATNLFSREKSKLKPGEKVTCPECRRNFSRVYDLQRHIKYVHFKSRLQCGYCQRGYTRPDNLVTHVKRVHSVDINISSLTEAPGQEPDVATFSNIMPMQ